MRHAAEPALRRSWRRGAALALSAALAAGISSTAAFAGSAPAPVSCAVLSVGARGPAVADVQRVVRTVPDGIFGPLTRAAVLAFQRAHRVAPTGRVDAATWRALPRPVALAACGAPVSGTASWCPSYGYGATGPDVAVLQRAVGTWADGDFGPLTEAAVRAAQRRLRLPVTGTATVATWVALHLSGTPACTGAPPPPRPAPAPHPAPVAPPGPGTGRPAGPGPHPAPGRPAAGDAAAQAAVRAEVARLLAQLTRQPARAGAPLAGAALGFALSQRGKPYVWGGVGPDGYDCSGLVLASYRSAGVNLPRTAAEQYDAGAAVPLSRLEPGDIVFYASDLTRPATIYHDALYAGHGMLVNAPYTGQRVREEPLFTTGLLPTAVRPATLLSLPLSVGARGWSVRQVQADLDAAGQSLAVDGDFGPLTAGGVRALQAGAHLRPTGVVDAATWRALVAAANARRR